MREKKYLKSLLKKIEVPDVCCNDDIMRANIKAKIINKILVVGIKQRDSYYIIFFEENDYLTYNVLKNRWNYKKYYYLLENVSNNNTTYLENSKNIIKDWFCKTDKEIVIDNIGNFIHFQQELIKNRINNRKKIEKFHNDMQVFKNKALPKKHESFVKEKVFDEEFAFVYDKKTKKAFCTYCEEEISIKNMTLSHNERLLCPCCKRKVVAKSKGIFQKSSYESVKWSMVIQRKENAILLRYIRNRLVYHKTTNYEIISLELLRDVITKDKILSYEYYWYKDIGFMWAPMRNYINPMNTWVAPSIYNRPKDIVYLFLRGIHEVKKADGFEHCQIEEYFKGKTMVNEIEVVRYLQKSANSTVLERLVKLGYKKLTEEYLHNISRFSDVKVFEKETKLHKMLGLENKGQLKMIEEIIPKSEISFRDICLARKYPSLNKEEYELLRQQTYAENVNWNKICQMANAGIIKVIHYINNKCEGKASSYRDYLELLLELNYPKSNSYFFPKNFFISHQRLVNEKQARQEKEKAEKLEKLNKKYIVLAEKMERQKMYHYENSKYCIVIPKDMNDFKKEGLTLHHCVYTNYFDKVAEGKTNIFFIRRKEEQESSFFTLEIRNGRLIQCLGKNNHTPRQENCEDVLEFAKEFETRLREFQQK